MGSKTLCVHLKSALLLRRMGKLAGFTNMKSFPAAASTVGPYHIVNQCGGKWASVMVCGCASDMATHSGDYRPNGGGIIGETGGLLMETH